MEVGDTSLSPTEGIIITKIHTNAPNAEIQIHNILSGWPIANIKGVKQPTSLHVEKFEVGSDPIVAYISKITIGRTFARTNSKGRSFIVKPGHLNYIGDIEVKMGQYQGESYSLKRNDVVGSVSTRFYDNEKETIIEAKKLYPELFEKYPYYSRYTEKSL